LTERGRRVERILRVLAVWFLLLFVGVWVAVVVAVIRFQPSASVPALDLSDAVVVTAGFIATAVGAGTAAVLGIAIQKVQADVTKPLLLAASDALKDKMLAFGVLVYAGVGTVVLITWLARPEVSPDLMKTFALGALGWFAGAFAGVFKSGK
jgi:hypothetical protein